MSICLSPLDTLFMFEIGQWEKDKDHTKDEDRCRYKLIAHMFYNSLQALIILFNMEKFILL